MLLETKVNNNLKKDIKHISDENATPLKLKIPNEKTTEAMNEAKNLIGEKITLEKLTK